MYTRTDTHTQRQRDRESARKKIIFLKDLKSFESVYKNKNDAKSQKMGKIRARIQEVKTAQEYSLWPLDMVQLLKSLFQSLRT